MTDVFTDRSITEKFAQLKAWGAGEFAHLNGTLEAHLKGTYELLRSWKANLTLCDAGLFHAAYGTDGFDEHLLSLDNRAKIADIIGEEAEQIVYLYCSCDRSYVFENIRPNHPVQFHNRFTDQYFELTEEQGCDFYLLTVANELEIAAQSTAFVSQHGEALRALFANMTQYLPASATDMVESVLGEASR